MPTATTLLIHLHLPRNAGTTLGRMLRLRLGLWPPSSIIHHSATLGMYQVKDYRRRLEAINGLPQRLRSRVRLFEAHAGFGLHEHLPEPSTYVTVLREPIDRALSVYYYQRQHRRIPEDMTLEDFVLRGDPQRVWWVDNAQVRYLAGNGGTIVDVERGRCTRAMLDIAIERLEQNFAFVGLLDRFEESVVLLRRVFGWRGCYYVHSNPTKVRKHAIELAPSQRQLLSEHNELDAELYQFAADKFQSVLDEAGDDFTRDLNRFRRGNARYNVCFGGIQRRLPAVRRALSKLKLIRS